LSFSDHTLTLASNVCNAPVFYAMLSHMYHLWYGHFVADINHWHCNMVSGVAILCQGGQCPSANEVFSNSWLCTVGL